MGKLIHHDFRQSALEIVEDVHAGLVTKPTRMTEALMRAAKNPDCSSDDLMKVFEDVLGELQEEPVSKLRLVD